MMPKLTMPKLIDKDYIRMKITPDSSARNYRTEDIVRTVANQFRLPIERIVRDGFKLTGYRMQERAAYEIEFKDKKVSFYMTIPEHLKELFYRRIASVWDQATIEVVEDPEPLDESQTVVYESVYRKHDLYSLQTDAKNNIPLPSIIESGRLLDETERGKVVVFFDPLHQLSWNYKISEAWQKMREGKAPRRFDGSLKDMLMMALIGVSSVFRELMGAVSDLVSNGKGKNAYMKGPIDPAASLFAIQQLKEATRQKPNKPAIKTYVWTAVQSPSEVRADLIARTIAMSFNDLAEDNELDARRIGKKNKPEVLASMERMKSPKHNIRYNLTSTAEAAKFIQLPGDELQAKYKEIERVELAEVEVVNKRILDVTGIPLGETTFKGDKLKVYIPIKNRDEVCLPRVGIGGMGQGKTKGLLSNYLLGAVQAGFGGLAIDPNKREIGDQIQHAVNKGNLPADSFIRMNLSKMVFALDFCEAMHDDRARARLANMIAHYFEVDKETSGQTGRFLRAAVMVMKTGRLSELLDIYSFDPRQDKKLDEGIKELQERGDDFNLTTLTEFKSYDAGMRRKILSPIMNRIGDILADPFLASCFKSDASLDFVDILSQRKAFVIDVPADELDKVAIDLIVSLVSLKIDLAMRMRGKLTGDEFPFFVMIDEPHQFSRSTGTWEAAVVESRKWGICYMFAFHYWEQIPSNLQKAIKSALPHFHLYPSSEDTFKNLKTEIAPFKVEEAMKLRAFHAINIMRTGGGYETPFIAKMLAPPTDRL